MWTLIVIFFLVPSHAFLHGSNVLLLLMPLLVADPTGLLPCMHGRWSPTRTCVADPTPRQRHQTCRCFVDRPVNLAPCCSRESMVAPETQRTILIRDGALHLVWRPTSLCSSIQVLQRFTTRGSQARVLQGEMFQGRRIRLF